MEYYRNEPRYVCKASDVEGHIFKALHHINRICSLMRKELLADGRSRDC